MYTSHAAHLPPKSVLRVRSILLRATRLTVTAFIWTYEASPPRERWVASNRYQQKEYKLFNAFCVAHPRLDGKNLAAAGRIESIDVIDVVELSGEDKN